MTRLNPFLACVVALILVSPMVVVVGKEYIVGDDEGWSSDVDYYSWLADKSFHLGDTLVFSYSMGDHNVIIVNATGYNDCISYPNQGAFYSGHDILTLNSLGNNYFICGYHCDYSDQKLNINVLPS